VRDSVISDSANYGYGIKVSAGSLDLTGTRLTRNAWGVYLNTLGSVTVKDNCFAGNAYYGLYNRRTDMTVDATLNWWGDPSGPRPLGTGDYAYDAPTNLAVSPWLVYDPTLAPPEVTLNVPPTFEVMLAMAAEVTSEVAIDRVEFYWDHDGQSTLLGTVEEAPYCFRRDASDEGSTHASRYRSCRGAHHPAGVLGLRSASRYRRRHSRGLHWRQRLR